MTGHDDEDAHWYEDESGPMVRPYTVTHGRTRSATARDVDLMAWVTAVDGAVDAADPRRALDHARTALLDLIRRGPRTLAELAAGADLPLTVVRVLLGDLVDAGLAHVSRPPTAGGRPEPELLREVVARLREL
ncbi:DUF742 domain-containing protein [Streptomyces sp. 8N616]|uniref:DUF742 domain-containing protein n=1 Tax=Streptomyces sp. 8N616 TaxID=3457414 RepID=UPI003FCF2768